MVTETLQTIDARRHELIRALRVFRDGNFIEAIQAVDADDLEWFLERIDDQLNETPHWVQDPPQLTKSLAAHRHARSIVASTLHNIRTIENKTASARAELPANVALITSGIGILLAILALILR